MHPPGCKPLGKRTDEVGSPRKPWQWLRVVTLGGLEWPNLVPLPPLLGTGPDSAPGTCILALC